jgi:SAM-dependent methyltransferase
MDRARAFDETIAAAKRRVGTVDFEWYPYGTLYADTHLRQLLSKDLADYLVDVCPRRRILDVGCGDGELSFFLESLGFGVVAIDHPTYNHNGMRGMRALHAALGSKVEVHEVDLDRQFRLPQDSYDAALFLGVLYHLRNPFYVLEELAKRTNHCLMSTRIAQRLPDGSKLPKGAPLAYLLDEHELNWDDSNYFIFTKPALQVMLRRCYWRVENSISIGSTHSDPVRQDRDERIFCLLESTYDRFANIELGEGWYEVEGSGWRWTQQEFSFSVSVPRGRTHTLEMQVFTPAGLLELFRSVVLSIYVNGRELPPAVLERPGAENLTRRFESVGEERAAVRFRLSTAIPGDASDSRDRGFIVSSVSIV